MKVYASISGGKDSLAALITHMERGGQCDGAIYCRIMFDDETLAAFLGTIPAIETPWDDAFHRLYCSSCSAADCDDCRRPERDSPLWWLGLPAAEAEK